MYIYENEKTWENGQREKRFEDLALKRALTEWKQDVYPRPQARRPTTSRESTTLFTKRRDFLKGLKRETPDVHYRQFPSPEFKPGRFYFYPCGVSPRNYNERRIGFQTQTASPGNQLCIKMKRKIFCEVLQEDKLCLDCNSRSVRGDFNQEIKREFPYLEYDRVKRPYGFCPRAIRLTEPLPASRDSTVLWHHNCDCSRTKSAVLPDINQANINGWLGIKACTM